MADNPIIVHHRALSDAATRVANAQRTLTRQFNAFNSMIGTELTNPDDLDLLKERFDNASRVFSDALSA